MREVAGALVEGGGVTRVPFASLSLSLIESPLPASAS